MSGIFEKREDVKRNSKNASVINERKRWNPFPTINDQQYQIRLSTFQVSCHSERVDLGSLHRPFLCKSLSPDFSSIYINLLSRLFCYDLSLFSSICPVSIQFSRSSFLNISQRNVNSFLDCVYKFPCCSTFFH